MSGKFKITSRQGGNYIKNITKEKVTLSDLGCSSISLSQDGNSYSGRSGNYSIQFKVQNHVATGNLSGPPPRSIFPSSDTGNDTDEPEENLETFSADVSFWEPPSANPLKLLWSLIRKAIYAALRQS